MARSALLLAVAAGAALGAAALARAQAGDQPEGPVIVGERKEKWKALEIQRLELSFEFLAQYDSNRLTQPGAPTLVDRETLLRYLLDVDTEFSIGHKNLLDITATAQLGLDDRRFDSDTVGISSDELDFVDLYDVRGTLLGNGPVPVTIYSRREESILDRAFAGRIEQLLNETGAIAQIQSEWAPTTLQYFHRDQNLTDPFGQTESDTTQDTFTGQSGMRFNENNRLDLAYTFDHIDENQPGFLHDSYDRHDANVVHTLTFGPQELKHELRSSFRLYDQGGMFAQSEQRLDELLLLRHSERLETRYDVTIDQQTRGGQDQTLYRGTAAVRHHLFDSLTSRASVGAMRLDAPEDFTSDDIFVTGQLDYTKKAWIGRIDASAGVVYDVQHNSARGGTLGVNNEPHVFDDPFPIILARRNIVPGSIVVTPPSGVPTFREGIDYTVAIFPDRAELTVLPGGAILDGQTVLVSYNVGPEPASDIDTTAFTVTFRYTLTEGLFNGLSAYTVYRTVDHTLDTADPSLFVLDDVNDLLVGVEYNRFGLDAKLEAQWRDSTVDPYNALRAQLFYTRPLGPGSSINLEYTHDTIDYTDQANHVDFDRVTARWYQRLHSSLDLQVRLEYRNERDERNGNSEAFEQFASLNWRKGQTTIYASVQNSFLNGPGSDTDSQFFQIGFRRRF